MCFSLFLSWLIIIHEGQVAPSVVKCPIKVPYLAPNLVLEGQFILGVTWYTTNFLLHMQDQWLLVFLSLILNWLINIQEGQMASPVMKCPIKLLPGSNIGPWRLISSGWYNVKCIVSWIIMTRASHTFNNTQLTIMCTIYCRIPSCTLLT